jgi:hypothetical protein
MDRPRHQLLAGAGLPPQQDRDVEVRHPPDVRTDLRHAGAVADQPEPLAFAR